MDGYEWLMAITGGGALLVAAWQLGFAYSERKHRKAEKLPRVSAHVRQNHQDGWYACALNIRNRLDCSIKFTRAEVVKPKGFLLAPGGRPFGEEIKKEMAGPVVDPLWEFGSRAEPEHRRTLYVKPPQNVRGNQAITISFAIFVQDAQRQELTLDVKTNAINWRASRQPWVLG